MELRERDIWVGSDYAQSRPRILILGESIYSTDDEPLRTYIPKWIRKTRNNPTFTRVFNGFAGGLRRDTSTEVQRSVFWNRIVFYNFAVDPVATRADRPSEALYRAAQEPLREVLVEHRPDGVLILGKGQEVRSGPVLSSLGIKYEACPHPTAYGVRTEVLTAAWHKLHDVIGA